MKTFIKLHNQYTTYMIVCLSAFSRFLWIKVSWTIILARILHNTTTINDENLNFHVLVLPRKLRQDKLRKSPI